MKKLYSIAASIALTAAMASTMTSCQNDFDGKEPGFDIPVATITPNTTLLDFKQMYWQDAVNYIDTVGTNPDGSHIIIAGRVISNDRAGNVYKKLVIQDETAALAISINKNSLYNDYRVGQEIVIDATGMYIGKYNGTEQLGYPDFYEKSQVWEATFMPFEFFAQHAQLNGLPEPQKIDTLVIRKFSELPSDPAQLAAFQSRIVRFNNVHFAEGGVAKYTTAYKENTNRILLDSDNQQITVRTSGYATFRDEILPAGDGDVIAILDYYATSEDAESPWQLTLNDAGGCINFGNPTLTPGAEDNPYTVTQAIELIDAGKTDRGWITGYIVGAVAPEVTTVSSAADIEFSADVVLANTLVIAPSADCTDWRQCMVISLPQSTALRELGNLRDNPANYKKQIWLYGQLDTYMGTYGITGNSGASSQFRIEGVSAPGGEIPAGNGTEASPYNVAQVIALNPTSTTESPAGGSGVWVKGYIVGSMPTGGSSTVLSGTNFSTADAATTNMVIAPTADCTDYTKCIGIQLPTGAVRTALNLLDNPGNLGAEVALYGDVMKYCSGPGLKNVSKYTLGEGGNGGGDTPVTPPSGNGDGTQSNPFSCSQVVAMNPQSTTEAAAGGSNVWIEGYIVGSMPTGGSSTVLSGTNFSTADAATTNMVIAPTADCKDYTLCVGIQLPTEANAPGVRSSLNLADNPGNLGKKVLLRGDVMKYCGGPGLKNTKEFVLNGNGGGGNQGGDTPNPPAGSGDGSETSPYTCSQVIGLNPTSTSAAPAGGSGVWVDAYIVGSIPSTASAVTLPNAVFSAENASTTNIVVAPSANCTDPNLCIAVQLPTEANAPGVRSSLNLNDNPGNLGKHVNLFGDVMMYCGAPGLKNTSKVKFVN